MHPPPTLMALTQALQAAGAAHHEYEQVVLKGVRHQQWSGFYAAYVIGRLGGFTTASQLALLLEEVSVPSDWSPAAARHVLARLLVG